jgi:O-antigen ligase
VQVTFGRFPCQVASLPEMIQFIRERKAFWVLVAIWVFTASHAPILLYAVLPISVLLMWRNEMWEDMLLGFILCAILSDMDPEIRQMAVMKTAKYAYIVTLALIFFKDQHRMRPLARIFPIFLPFLIYAFLPIVRSSIPVISFEKTVSYGLVLLVMPNLVLHNFRRHGWDSFKNMIWFITLVLVAQQMMRHIGHHDWAFIGDRFRGFFGNPNGMAIFCHLSFMLVAVVSHLQPQLFSRGSKIFIFGVIIYYLITCGARTSLVATLMFVMFIQFFRISMLLGIISFLAFIGLTEILSSNLPAIITALGLQDYMRVDTISDGSGRYIAWSYAWGLITNDGYFFFGAGFENEFHLMYEARHYLSALGHQGGVHNSYLAFWLNTGIVGLLLFMRSLVLIFIKASKNTPIAMAILFSVLFSILYESWLAGSLNPYTVILLVVLTIVSEEEIMNWEEAGASKEESTPESVPQQLILPAR